MLNKEVLKRFQEGYSRVSKKSRFDKKQEEEKQKQELEKQREDELLRSFEKDFQTEEKEQRGNISEKVSLFKRNQFTSFVKGGVLVKPSVVVKNDEIQKDVSGGDATVFKNPFMSTLRNMGKNEDIEGDYIKEVSSLATSQTKRFSPQKFIKQPLEKDTKLIEVLKKKSSVVGRSQSSEFEDFFASSDENEIKKPTPKKEIKRRKPVVEKASDYFGSDSSDDELTKELQKDEFKSQRDNLYGNKPSSIDVFLKEMDKEKKELNPKRYRPSGTDYYKEDDPDTTNLFIGNIHPKVIEDELYDEFKRFGDIISVKIMWPKRERRSESDSNNGFVLFTLKEDAARARQIMNGSPIRGYVLRVGWGKKVPIEQIKNNRYKRGTCKSKSSPQEHKGSGSILGKRTREYSKYEKLNREDQEMLQRILIGLNIERKNVLEAMLFCMSRVEACSDIIEIINEYVQDDSHDKSNINLVGVLYLVSDLLSNFDSKEEPLAESFRTKFKPVLPFIIQALYNSYSKSGRIDASQMKQRVFKVLDYFKKSILLENDFVLRLESIFT